MAVTVIIPYYNHGIYLGETLNSIYLQSYQDWEILIVDDGSDEKESIEFLKSLKHPKVKIIRQNHNGPGSARNLGVSQSNSEYIVFIDADDKFEIRFIEKAMSKINENTRIAAVSSWARKFGEINKVQQYIGGDYLNFLIKNESVNAALIKRSIFEEAGGYDNTLNEGLEDWDFWIRVTMKGYIIKILKEPLFNYRIKKESRNEQAMKNHDKIKGQIFLKYRDFFNAKYPEILFELIKRKNEQFQTLLDNSIIHRFKKLFGG